MFSIDKRLNAKEGIKMIETVLERYKHKLPEGKTINHFGGGYVEVLKTKAKVVLYFGFDAHKNRVSISFEVNKEDILLWQEAIAEKLWNGIQKEDIVNFVKEPFNSENPFI